MKYLFAVILISVTSLSFSQSKNQKDSTEVLTMVSDPAWPNMKMEEYYAHLGTLIKYPTKAKKEGIEGKVYVEFVINKKGKVTDAKVIKGIGSGCDEIALKAVKSAGDWKPGKNEGKLVNHKIVLPITFKL